MPPSIGLESSLSLPRERGVERRAARGKVRKLALVWIACAALSWALTVVVGYSVMRFGDATAGGEVMARSTQDADTMTTEALSEIAPAAGSATEAEAAN